MQVAGRLDVHIDPRVPGKKVKHMIEKTDSGRDRRGAAAVKVDCHRNVGFLGGALYRSLAHMQSFQDKIRAVL
jgi:hypothetical protein